MRKYVTTINAIRVLSTAIMGIAAYVSYGTQRHVLESWGVEADAAALIPLTIDALAMIANLAIHAPGVDRSGRRVAMTVLVFSGLVSMGANAFAGATWGSRIAHVWCVAAYLLAEWVAAKVKAAKTTTVATTLVSKAVAATTAVTAAVAAPTTRVTQGVAPETLTPAEVATPVAVVEALPPVAPVSPAPTGRPVWAPERTLPDWTPLHQRRQVTRKAA